MGNPKQKWTAEEEDALRAGVAKYGTGRWKNIQTDPEFNPHLYSRSNIDLKDKWRNMNPNGQGPREKARTPKAKSVDRSCTEKVQNCYRLQGEVSNGGTKGPIPRPKENHPRLSPINSHLGETLEEAAVAAAYEVAEAENKSFVAAEAVKEAERVSRMAEEAEAFLQFVYGYKPLQFLLFSGRFVAMFATLGVSILGSRCGLS